MKQILAILFLLLLPVLGLAQDNSGWKYKGDKSITEYTIPYSSWITKIALYAFENCANLKKVTISPFVNEIDGIMFSHCDALEQIEVDPRNRYFTSVDGVLFNYDTTKIVYCPNAKATDDYKIPESVTTIGYGAFFGCKNLTKLNIPNHITEIHESAFEECTNITSVSLPESVKIIKLCAFSSCYKLQKFEVDSRNQYFSTIDGVLFNFDKTKLVSCPNKTQYAIPSKTRIIGEYAFQGCKDMEGVTIPNSVKIIEQGAFSYCNGLTSISIPKSVKEIGSACFWSSENINTILLPNDITKIDRSTFKNCKNLATITIPNSVKEIGDYAFLNCDNLTEVVISNNVQTIGEGAFANCKKLESIIIPQRVEGINNYAFYNCKNLKSVVIEQGAKKWIGESTFKNCESLIAVKLEEGLEYIGSSMFAGCKNLTIINMPQSLENINGEAFSGCKNLTTINMPKGLKNIYSDAFYGCEKITSINIPKSTDVWNDAFYGATVQSITIEEGVDTIRSEAFAGCLGFTTITIPGSVKMIEQDAFYECDSLQTVIIENGDGIYIEDGFRGCKNLKKMVINSSAVDFDYFLDDNGAENLETVIIGDNLKTIPEKAFLWNEKLKTVTIGNSVETIGKSAFQGCDSLASVIIPRSVKKIGKNAFTNLTSISCPDDSSARMKLLLNKCMADVHIYNNRYDSANYYINIINEIIRNNNDLEDDLVYKDFSDYYSKICDYTMAKYYLEKSIEICSRNPQDSTFNDKLNSLLLDLASVCISLKEYDEADSALSMFEKRKNIIRTANDNCYMEGCPSDDYEECSLYRLYYYLLLKMYYEQNDNYNLKVFNCEKYSFKGRGSSFEVLQPLWLRINTIIFNNLSVPEFESRKSDSYFRFYIKRKRIISSDCSLMFSTIGDCYYYYNKMDSAFVYYSIVFKYELSRLKDQFSLMNIYQRQNYWQVHKSSFDNMVKISTKLSDDNEAVEMAYNSLLVSKGLLLSSEQSLDNIIQNSNDEKLIKSYFKLKTYRVQIDTLSNSNKRDSLRELAGRLETDLMRRSSQFADVVNYINVDWQKVKNSLEENDVAIEFFYDRDSLYALVLKKDFESPKLVLLGEFDYKSPFNGGRNVVEGNSYSTLDIYNAVWKPLEKYFSEKGKVYFSPSGKLYNIAIEYAPIDEKRLISEKYKLYRISSTRYLALNAQKTSGKKPAAVFGGIKYNFGKGDWDDLKNQQQNETDKAVAFRDVPIINVDSSRSGVIYLPGTKTEAENVANSLRAAQYDVNEEIGAAATEGSFKNLSGSRLKIIHIGTHGFYEPSAAADDNGMTKEDRSLSQSGLLFAGANSALDPKKRKDIPEGVDDGILTAKEISRLDFKNLDLVVLSACQTGLGEVTGEGVFGLQRGFKKAGAQTIIMSLWNVDDYATRLLMSEFYKNLVSGKSKREAFLAAQAYVRHKNSDPKYWAAFIMVDAM